MDLNDKVALITGSAIRVGKAMAMALAGQGCRVIIHYNRSAQAARETRQEIEALGVEAWTIQANLAEEAAIETIIPLAWEQAGRLDILINNASIFPPEDFLAADSGTWDQAMLINLKAPFLLSQAFARALPEGRPGKIINLLDANSMRPRNHHFSYTISKAGLEALTQATAHALAGRNIQVNGLALGLILPPPTEDGPELFERLARRIPARRTGSPQDVVAAMLYLLRAGDYVTGEIIRLDGGWHLA